MDDRYTETREALLDAILVHVAFDGWSEASFRAAIADAGVSAVLAEAICPRGAVDLALAFHARGDSLMCERLQQADLSEMRFRDRIAAAVRFRLEAAQDKEAVRRGVTLFALPQYAADGARAIWGTCDQIWTTLGDSSDDFNWYSKRATLSGVYSATLLYWLGDDSADHQASWDFLDRRIDNVMQIEKLKAQVNKSPVLGPLMAGPNWVMKQIRPPVRLDRMDLPGMMQRPPEG